MAGQKVQPFIPMASGHDASTDERVQPAARLLRLENCEFVDRGAVRQRHGFFALGGTVTDTSDMSSARALVSTGTELVAVREYDVVAYDFERQQWMPRAGAISPWACDRRVLLRDEQSFPVCDSMRCNDVAGLPFVIHAVQTYQRDQAGIATIGLAAWAENTFDQVVVPRTSFDQAYNVAANQGHAPVCAFSARQALVVYQLGTVNPSPLHMRFIDSDNTAAGVQDFGSLAAGAYFEAVGGRTYHAIGRADASGWNLAYIDNATKGVHLQKRNTAHATIATVNIAKVCQRVAMCEHGTQTLALVESFAAGVYQLDLYALTTSSWTIQWGPTTVRVGAENEFFENVGVACDNIGGTLRVICTWGIVDLGASPRPSVHLESRTVKAADGTIVDATYQAWNCIPVTQPWIQNARAYVTVAANQDVTSFDAARFGAATSTVCAVLELRAGETTRTPRVGAYHNIGDAMLFRGTDNQQGAFGRGAGNSVWLDQDGAFNYDATMRADTGEMNGGKQVRDRFGVDAIALGFAPSIGAVSVYRGTALIGGALVSWYDGARAFECGEPIAPIITSAAAADLTPDGLLAGDYLYVATTESRDQRGVVHRGFPGPVSDQVNVAGMNDGVQVSYRFISLTNHADNDAVGERMAIDLYRSDGAGGFVKARPPIESYANSIQASGAYRTTETDDGYVSGAQLYTTTGEIESVSPEGGLFPAIVSNRCWLAQCSEAADVRLSKAFFAASNGTRYAPEFSDALSLVLPGDDTAVAIAALDDKTIIFASTRTYALAGEGPDDRGAGSTYGTPQRISADVGCRDARSVVTTPMGVFFQAAAGIYLLTRNLELEPVGEAVRDVLATYPVVTSAQHLPDRYQVRFTCAARQFGNGGTLLVYDYRVGAWAEWLLNDLDGNPVRWIGACMHRPSVTPEDPSIYYLLGETGMVVTESLLLFKDTFSGARDDAWVPQGLETSWQQLPGQSGWARSLGWIPLLKGLGPFDLRVRIYTDFNADPDVDITVPTATIAGWPEYPRVQPFIEARRQEGTAFKLRIDTVDPGDVGDAQAQGFSCAGITAVLMPAEGPVKVPNEARI